jgi:hypothetical protein
VVTADSSDSSGTKYGVVSTTSRCAECSIAVNSLRLFSSGNPGPLGTTWQSRSPSVSSGCATGLDLSASGISSSVSENQSVVNTASSSATTGPSKRATRSTHRSPRRTYVRLL